MDYKGLYIDFEEFGESYAGCHCTVYTSEKMEHEVDDFFISPSELSTNPDVEEWARVKTEERIEKYAVLGYVPALAKKGAH